MGFEDEVERSFGRPCRLAASRSKPTCELTSSIVPRGTPFHCWVDLEFSPIGFDLHSAAPGDLHGPGLEPGPFLRMQHALRCFVEHHPHHLIPAARYPAAPVDFAGLIRFCELPSLIPP